MPKKLSIDEINKRLSIYGMLLIGNYTYRHDKTQIKCHCGNIFETAPGNIFCGDTTSCGCVRKLLLSQRMLIDLTGQKFGRLFVLELLPKDGKYRKYKCLCDCGMIKSIIGVNLTDGTTKSCGCLKRRKGKENPCYKIELTKQDRIDRRCLHENEIWTKTIFERDNFTCQICKKHGGDLNAHHLDGYGWCEVRRFDINNGILLCENCHRDFHRVYGIKVTEQQFLEYQRLNIW